MKTGHIEVELMKAQREANRWRRISNQLFEALIARGTPEEDKEKALDAIETYLNYICTDDDE